MLEAVVNTKERNPAAYETRSDRFSVGRAVRRDEGTEIAVKAYPASSRSVVASSSPVDTFFEKGEGSVFIGPRERVLIVLAFGGGWKAH